MKTNILDLNWDLQLNGICGNRTPFIFAADVGIKMSKKTEDQILKEICQGRLLQDENTKHNADPVHIITIIPIIPSLFDNWNSDNNSK